jgi:hypothetical protein
MSGLQLDKLSNAAKLFIGLKKGQFFTGLLPWEKAFKISLAPLFQRGARRDCMKFLLFQKIID